MKKRTWGKAARYRVANGVFWSGMCAPLVGAPVMAQGVSGPSYMEPGQRGKPDSWKTAEFLREWGLGAMNAQYAYAAGHTGKNSVIGVLDSGYYDKHPELAPSRFSPVFSLGISGVLNARNDTHGTKVSGVIGASRDGLGVHGVAPDSKVFVGNTNASDGFLFGVSDPKYSASNANYLSEVYAALARAGVRVVNNSWGSQPLAEKYDTLSNLIDAYRQHEDVRVKSGQGTWLDGAAKMARSGVINNFSSGNSGYANASVRGAYPYFRPELEGHWLTTTGYSASVGQVYNQCGIAKWWCVMAPTGVESPSFKGNGPDPSRAVYANFNGTSAAAPHASGALGLIMERFPYMTNEQALMVMFTTAQNMAPAPGRSTTRDDRLYSDVRPAVVGSANYPNEFGGWGLVDLRKAMNGPAQLLGRTDFNLPGGRTDTWSNDISQDAIVHRRKEEQAEVAGWQTRKASLPGGYQGDQLRTYLDGLRRDAIPMLKKLAAAIQTQNFSAEYEAVQGNPIAASVLTRLLAGIPYGKYLTTSAAKPLHRRTAYRISQGLQSALNANSFSISDGDVDAVKAALQFEYKITEERIARLTGKLTDPSSYDAGLAKSGGGILILAGKNTYMGETRVNGGELVIDVNGSITSPTVVNAMSLFTVRGRSADITINGGAASVDGVSGKVTVNNGGILGGNGTLQALAVNRGGTVSPGHSAGTLRVAGDVGFAPGSRYDVEVKADGSDFDRIIAAGKATLTGGTLGVRFENAANLLDLGQVLSLEGRTFEVLTAADGLTGRFDAVEPNYLFLAATPTYGAQSLTLRLGRNTTAFASVAGTPNERRVAGALDTLAAGMPVYQSVLGLATAEQARGAFRQLAGEIYPATQAALMRDSRMLRDAVSAQQQRARTAEGPRVWAQPLSSWSRTGNRGEVDGYRSHTTGFVAGGDAKLTPTLRAGLVAGYSRKEVRVPGMSASSDVDSYHLGAYASWRPGAWGLLLGTAHSWHDGKIKRSVAYGGVSDTLKGGFGGDTQQFFAETSYRHFLGERSLLEPYAGLAYVSQQTHRKRESGGGAALEDRGSKTHAAMSSMGLRGQTGMDMGKAGQLKLSAGLGWQYVLTGTTQQARLGFTAGGASYQVATAPLERSSALVDLGAELVVNERFSAGLSYGGSLAGRGSEHSARGNLTWKF
ncbi:autotransporter domain-containing protein [Achromobacter xylosoxidans]